MIVATAGLHVLIFQATDIELGKPLLHRQSCMKMQTRCVAAFPEGHGFAMGSVEGKVSFEYIEEAADKKRFVFKCHREKKPNANPEGVQEQIVNPVNTISFHPKYGTFATGGCDGVVNIWDGMNQKRIFALPKYPTSIAAVAFNHEGNLLAVASSYTFERGHEQHPPDQIYIRAVVDAEVRPKTRV